MRAGVVLLILASMILIIPAGAGSVLTPGNLTSGNNSSCITCSACSGSGTGTGNQVVLLDGAVVKANIDSINREIKDKGLSWTAGESPLAYMAPESYQAMLGLKEDTRGATMHSHTGGEGARIDSISLPSSLDWRSNNGDWTTPVRDQGSCGSCWAFSIIGTFESYYERMAGDPTLNPDFSEQYLVSCNRDQYSCSGGYFSAFDLIVDEPGKLGGIGTVRESDYPYTATTGTCKDLAGKTRYAVSSGTDWYYISTGASIPTVNQIKQAILTYGPVSAAFYATNNFRYYKSGIYEEPGTYNGANHAIVIVGWGYDSTKGKDYWICKNSWGSSWGERGWFRIYTDQLNIGYGAAYLSAPSENPAPVISSISPTEITAGSPALTLTLTGSGFLPVSKVRWNGGDLATTCSSSTRLTAAIPASYISSPTGATITVYNPAPGGGVSNGKTFTVKAMTYSIPVIKALSPAAVAVNSPAFTLTVTGTDFGPASIILWDGEALSTTVKSTTSLTAAVSASRLTSTGTHQVTVRNPDPGGRSDAAIFTITVQNNPVPSIRKVSPSSTTQGVSGLTLTITGKNFISDSQVYWGTTPLTSVYVSSTSLTATVPARLLEFPGSARIYVHNPEPGGGNSSRALFTIRRSTSAPVISSVTPRTLTAGVGDPVIAVKVTGSRFATDATVTLTRDDYSPIKGVISNFLPRTIYCAFTVPGDPTYSGSWDLVVANGDGLKAKKAILLKIE